jgi:putative sterol carrier protein
LIEATAREGGVAPEVFTEGWARAWGEELSGSAAYRQAAAKWEGVVVLVMEADPTLGVAAERAVFADLWHGECRGAGAASPEQRAQAPTVIVAGARSWRDVLADRTDPVFGLLSGSLRLERGNMVALVPFTAAAREMVAAARRVEASLPAGWR